MDYVDHKLLGIKAMLLLLGWLKIILQFIAKQGKKDSSSL